MNNKVTCAGRTVRIETADEFTAAQVTAALTSKQWVRLVDGALQIADAGPEPKMSDHERLIMGSVVPCFPVPDDKIPVPTQRTPGKDGDLESCYVKHIGAGLRGSSYERVYKLMVAAGFVLLRSAKGDDNKYWEIWYLPGLWALQGPVKGADRKTLVKWLFDYVTPGNVAFSGEAWALTFD